MATLVHAQPGAETPVPPPTPAPPIVTDGAAPPIPDDAALGHLFTVIFSPWTPSEARIVAVENPIVRDVRAVPPLTFLLERDRDPHVRAAAARMLGRIPTDAPLDIRAQQQLVASARARTEEGYVRIAAIEALRWAGGDQALEPLRELYTSATEDAPIRDAAKAAIAARWPAELE